MGRKVVDFSQNRNVIVIVFRKQGSYFAQLFRSLLEHFDLLAQLSKFCLLLPQNLMNVLHSNPLLVNLRRVRSSVNGNPMAPITGVMGGQRQDGTKKKPRRAAGFLKVCEEWLGFQLATQESGHADQASAQQAKSARLRNRTG